MHVDATHADDGDMPLGLRKRGGRYVIRRRVPLDLVEVIGRREITKALGTGEREEAKRLGRRWWVERDEEFEALRISVAASDDVDCGPTATSPNSVLSPVTGEPISPTVIALVNLDELRDRREAAFKDGRLPEFSRECEEALALYQAMLEGRIPPDGSDLRVIEGKRNGLRAFLSGEGAMGLAVKRRTLVPSSEAQNQLRSLTTTSWEQLVMKWAAERKPATKTQQAHQSVAASFVRLVGNAPVENVTKADVLRFKDGLVGEGCKPANLRTKLSRLKTLINYGYENDLVSVRAADGVRAPKPKGKARVPFDDTALTKLFNGPIHSDGERPTQGRSEASYWLPLIALFTGSRLEEIAGLMTVDLIELGYQDEGGIDQKAWFFRFSPDPDRGRTLKNDESERLTPVHPELIRLGLLRYVQSMEAAGETQLFPRLTAHASGKRAHKWGQWFGRYLRSSCGVSDRRTVFHSFRHSLKDAGRECGVPEELQRAIMGHSLEGVAGSYGLGFSRRRIVEGMAQIRIPGLPRLKPQH